jgi:tRNA (adenine57-N1/adenine58-N1)-methyltransferase
MATKFTALREDGGRVHIVPLIDEEMKIKGVGRINPIRDLAESSEGERMSIGQKSFLRLHPNLPEIRAGLRRRAQVINPKDAGMMIAWMGIGSGDTVLEAGFGSGGLTVQLLNVMGSAGTLISVENRSEHAEVGLENVERCRGCLTEMPTWILLEGDVAEIASPNGGLVDAVESLDAAILDLPEPWLAIGPVASHLRLGGRLACYCPSPDQLAKSWTAVEAAGLSVDWCGELMERGWKQTKMGGVRPGNTPMGHTALLLFAVRG